MFWKKKGHSRGEANREKEEKRPLENKPQQKGKRGVKFRGKGKEFRGAAKVSL